MRALIACLLLLAAGPSLAFEVEGYRAGMPIAEIQQRKANVGWRWLPLPRFDSMQSVVALAPGNSARETFGFCRNRLSSYMVEAGGGFSTFASAVERETKRLGPGSYTVHNSVPPAEPANTLEFSWPDRAWEVHISLMISESRPQMFVVRTWEMNEPCN
jgi:hypothetical protein